jgi:hypothetical protein
MAGLPGITSPLNTAVFPTSSTDIGGVNQMFSNLGMNPTKGQFGPKDLLTNETKVAVQGIDQTTSSKKTVALAKADVAPVKGQPNDTPVDLGTTFSNTDFSTTDYYRYGSGDASNGESFTQRTLSGEIEQIASMSLTTQGTSAVDIITGYSRFFLQSVSEAEQEKYQVVETFTGYYAFFYGKRPPIYRYSGVFLSDPNYRWNNDFKFVYENFFRGTSAVELLAEMIISYDGRTVIGFPLSLTMQQEASNSKGVPFTIDLLVVDHQVSDNLSMDVNTMLQNLQNTLAATKAKIKSTQATVSSGVSASVLTSDNVTNGIIPASSISIPGVPAASSAISQLGLA